MTADPVPAPPPAGARAARRSVVPAPSRAGWIVLWTAAVAGELGALSPLVLGGDNPFGEPVYLVFRLVGGSFTACGLIAWHRRPDNRSGLLMTATGFAFYVSPLLGLVDHPLATTIGHWLPDLWILFFVPLLLTFLTGGRLRTRVDRVLVGAVAVEVFVLAPLYLAFSPIEDNVMLVVAHPQLAAVVDVLQRTLLLAVCLATVVVVGARFRGASPPRRRALLPGVAGAACLLLFAALLVIDLVHAGSRVPRVSQVVLWLAACSIATVPLAFLVGLLRSRLARGGLTELVRALRTVGPDELQPTLAAALGDPALLVAYARPDGSYVDGAGAAVPLPGPDAERSIAVVERDGAPVAALLYDRTLDDDPELVEAVGAAATIALETRQLQAEAQARLAELAASRERIIAAGDAERRRIERNLHDGAQQGLVTLALQLSLIQRRIREDPADAELLVTSAGDELARSLAELRELARGIHPATLDHGLDIALDALATRSAVPTTVTVEPGPVLPEPVAFAAYCVASEALTNVARYARAGSASVSVRRPAGAVVVEIVDDGVGGADPALGTGLRGLGDRVEALGGTFAVSGAAGGGTVVAARMPLDR
ncbi:sensor histidine kinase [Pseudonocardia lacus]|uniref:sensor histidine kinase n=1 Tax=Pseudonocardia lacus TaxID=2835865 RepID=UPI001BDCBB72|nr:sensor histidine kinase [Pseudonocardia lacus]